MTETLCAFSYMYWFCHVVYAQSCHGEWTILKNIHEMGLTKVTEIETGWDVY